ncbi:MAG: hypothetical protein KDB14_30925 [Planctomycetales bacterium]|nr:hypothetical protein [Planctomycetales bacterium]
MSIRKEIEADLGRRVAAGSAGGGDIVARSGDGEVRVRVSAVGPIGVSVDEIQVKRSGLDAAGARRACEQVGDRVKYLLEPLRVLESDAQSGVTRARSEQPSVDDAGRHYYELNGQPGELKLNRYCKPDTAPRSSEAMDLTREQLYRLAEDLDAAARAS